MSKQGPLRPPKEYQKYFTSWWLCSLDGDGRRQPPEVWEWSPQRRQWHRSGMMLCEEIGLNPDAMGHFIIVSKADVPMTWYSCEDMADRTESQPK